MYQGQNLALVLIFRAFLAYIQTCNLTHFLFSSKSFPVIIIIIILLV